MAYTICIGNAVPEGRWEDGPLDVYWDVRAVTREDAPVDQGTLWPRQNIRSPSYSAWPEFAYRTKLDEWFFDSKTGKMREVPGCAVLTPADVEIVKNALDAYRPKKPSGGMALELYTGDIWRLEWLNYWVAWAVKSCKRPAIVNR